MSEWKMSPTSTESFSVGPGSFFTRYRYFGLAILI